MVELAQLPPGTTRIPASRARELVSSVFSAAGFPASDASLIADVLIGADLRGVRSHGLSRLPYFMVRVERGVLNATPNLSYTSGSSTTGVLDADNGHGAVACAEAMDRAISMAQEHGSGWVAVANSNHFGYAGYWAERARAQGCIGFAMANGAGRVTPTFGRDSLLGTNPLAVGIPGGDGETEFLLDMATSVVAVGKVETALREGRPIPDGWVDQEAATASLDDRGILGCDTPLLPLGGSGDVTGGHKGFALNLMVELLCGVLGGTSLVDRIEGASGHAPAAMGQFVGAIRLDGFRPASQIHQSMAETIDIVRGAEKAPGHDTIYIPGEPEAIATAANDAEGIPVTPSVRADIETVAKNYGLEVPW
ncbi:MAG: L-2-hydroxycarboxylate dehydrogenase (NAD+) [Verrucomicrobiales bacterium]|jgi:L-2-hydroxycarboxylate dehydrogenase (NAD+)